MNEVPESAAFEVLTSNRWFIVGQDEGGYGVWSADDEGDAPLRRFPPTDEGSEAAFDAFASMSRARRGTPVLWAIFVIALVSGVAWVFTNGYVAITTAIDNFSFGSEADRNLYRWLGQISQSVYPVFLVSSGTFVMLWLMRHDSR